MTPQRIVGDGFTRRATFILPIHRNPANLLSDLGNPPPWISIRRFQPDNPQGPVQISYDLNKGGPTVPPKISCQETRPGTWKLVQTGS